MSATRPDEADVHFRPFDDVDDAMLEGGPRVFRRLAGCSPMCDDLEGPRRNEGLKKRKSKSREAGLRQPKNE